MEPLALLEALIDLAREQGLDVRRMAPEPGPDGPPTSGVARVRDRVWVLLSDADPPARRAAVVAEALVEHCAAELDARYLPPAVRAALDDVSG